MIRQHGLRRREVRDRLEKPGQLMLWRIVNPPSEGQRFPVNDLHHAAQLYNALTASDLLDDAISSNAYGLEIFEGGEWTEFESDECDGIADLADEAYTAELTAENHKYIAKYPKP